MAFLSGFRIICDLSDFFHESDMRRKSFMFVDLSRYQTVNDFCKRIQSTFNIETSIALAVDGHFLPHAEDIRILCNDDAVRVFKIDSPGNVQSGIIHVVTSNRRKKRNKCVASSDVRGTETDEVNELADDLGNNRDDMGKSIIGEFNINRSIILEMGNGPIASVDTLTTDIENVSPVCRMTTSVDELRHKKKRKRKHNSQTEDKSTGDKENSVNETLITEPKCDTSIIQSESMLPHELISSQGKDLVSVDVKECPVIPLNGLPTVDSDATKKKRKRYRTRQRRPKGQRTFNDEHILTNENLNSTPGHNQQSNSNSYMRLNTIQTSLESNLSLSKHVRFVNGNHTENINDFNNCDVENDVRACLPMNGVQESDLHQKNGVSLHSDVIPPELQVVNLPNNSALHIEKQTTGAMTFDKILSLAHSTPIVVKRDVPSKAIVVENTEIIATPVALENVVKHDVLTFKIWKMDDNYCPQISELITAKVLLNATSLQQLTLEVLEGNDYCLQPRGKFDLTEEADEECEQNNCSIIHLQWQDIIEPHYKTY